MILRKRLRMRTNRILLIYTGGTIGMGCNPQTGALEPLDFNHLVNARVKTCQDRHRCLPVRPADRLQRHEPDVLGPTGRNHYQTLPLARWLCHSPRHRHDGLHGISLVVHARKPDQTGGAHRFAAAYGPVAHGWKRECRDKHRTRGRPQCRRATVGA